jgi:hypothetical protein
MDDQQLSALHDQLQTLGTQWSAHLQALIAVKQAFEDQLSRNPGIQQPALSGPRGNMIQQQRNTPLSSQRLTKMK